MNPKILIRKIKNSDNPWIKFIFNDFWGGNFIATKGIIHNIKDLDGFIAIFKNEKAGLITFRIADNEFEIVSLNSFVENIGIGSALLEATIKLAKENSKRRVWLVTTNDNIDALKFYQKRNFRLKKIYPDAIKASRELKPSIPLTGNYGIAIKNEIELELII